MKTKIVNGRGTAQALRRLMRAHDEIHIAVAWGYDGPLAEELLLHKRKFKSVTIGLNGFATAPGLVKKLVEVPNAFIAQSSPGLFHPKIYYFQSGDRAAAIIGSANFTRGGFEGNVEAGVLFEGRADSDVFIGLRKELAGYAGMRKAVTREIAKSYARQHKIACVRRPPRDPILPDNKKKWKLLNTELATMEWPVFARKAREDPAQKFAMRIRLLHSVQTYFVGIVSINALSSAQWKAIGGVLGKTERDAQEIESFDWGWFGSMGGNGDFATRMGAKNPELAAAIDSIPRAGLVTEADYDRFCDHFRSAFVSADHKGNVATASRLLAMTRPDSFVCVNGRNRPNLAAALGFAPTTLVLSNYWARVIEPIRLSPWYNVPRPEHRYGELWDYRAAMLDAIYYDQSDKI